MGNSLLTFTPATVELCRELAPMLRAGDLAEVLAAGFPSALAALESSLAVSDVAGVALFEGRPAVMYGLVPLSEDTACAWALTGTLVEGHRFTFWRWSRELVAQMLRHYPVLVNAVDARYARAIRWLEALGFEVEVPKPHPASGHPFCRVILRRH